MENASVFSFEEISNANLIDIFEKQREQFELRASELSFVTDRILTDALELFDSGMSVYEVLMLLAEELCIEDNVKDSHSDVCDLPSLISQISNFDKIMISDMLASKISAKGIPIEESSFLSEIPCEEDFTYVRNALADEAYDVFSAEFKDPKVFYSESFKEACFAVADGKVGYCILPFEEKGGVRISGIHSLISALDLKVVSITPVFGFEGNADMKYALVSAGFKIPEQGEDVDRYLEISIGVDSKLGISSVLSAAESFGLTLYKVNTISSNEDLSYSLVFKDGGNSFVSFLSYMTLFSGGYVPVGIYKNIE